MEDVVGATPLRPDVAIALGTPLLLVVYSHDSSCVFRFNP